MGDNTLTANDVLVSRALPLNEQVEDWPLLGKAVALAVCGVAAGHARIARREVADLAISIARHPRRPPSTPCLLAIRLGEARELLELKVIMGGTATEAGYQDANYNKTAGC
jgi:hypothetical protein